MEETSNEKSQATAASATSPQVSLPTVNLLETASLPILRSDLELARSEYRLGHFAELRSNLAKILSRVESSLESNDNETEIRERHLIRATALTILGQTLKRSGEDQEADTSFKSAVTEFKEWSVAGDVSAEVCCDFGIALYHAGLIPEAIATFAVGAEKGALNAEAYRLYGISLSQQQENAGKLSLAEKQFRESVKLNPSDPLGYQALGDNLHAQGRQEEALDNYRQAAVLMISNGSVAEAEELVTHALAIGPPDADLLLVKGYALTAAGRFEEALRFLNESLVLAPDQAMTLGLKGQALAVLGREEEGLACLQHAVNLDSSQPWLFFSLGSLLTKLGRHQEALEPLDKAVSLAPDYALAVAAKGVLLNYLHQNEAAKEVLQRAVELDPTLGWAFASLGNTLLDLGQAEDALVALDKALSLSPDDFNLMIGKTRALRARGRVAEALEILQQVVKSHPDSTIAWAELADAHYSNRSYEIALASADSALELSPEFGPVLITKGRVLKALDRDADAVEVLKRAVELDASSVAAHAELGGAFRKVGLLEESLRELNEALKSEPDSIRALRYKGETLREMGRSEEALDVLNYALTLGPNDPWLMVSKGAVLRVSDRADEAVELLEQAVKLDENLPRGWAELGAALYTVDRNDDALEAFERALLLKPNYDLALKYKGETLRFLDRYDEALVCLDRALAVSPNDAWTLGAKGQTLRSLNRELEASEILERAVAAGPGLSWAWAELGLSYQAQERPEEAIIALKKSLDLNFNVELALHTAQIQCDIADYDLALVILNRAIERAPDLADLYGLKGWVYENQGVTHGQEAYQEYSTAHRLSPDDLYWLGGLANSLYLLEGLSKAEEKYREVLKKALEVESPGNDILSLIGWSHYRLGNYEEAIRSFISLVRENPADISDQFNLGLGLFGNSQASLGRREYERGIELTNRKATPLQRGWLHVAIDDMNVAIAVEPSIYNTDEFNETQTLMKKALEEVKNPKPKVSSEGMENHSGTVSI